MARFGILLVLCIFTVSCAPQTRFVWGSYEDSLYKYYKNPDYRDKYQASLEKAITKGEETGKVAPGLFAELGFLALESGDSATAVNYFEKEMTAFPESQQFMLGVIHKINQIPDTGESQEHIS